MASMGNLRDIFELVINGFNNRAFARQNAIEQGQKTGFWGFLLFLGQGNQLNALHQELFKEGLGDIALIAKKFPS